MIVNYTQATSVFNLTPEEALDYWRNKGLKQTWNWYQMQNEEHDIAMTVAKMMDIDLLATVQRELDKAIANGTTLDDFSRNLIPVMQRSGWWGKFDYLDDNGNVKQAQLGSASRLEKIFRTNLQSAYAAGAWESIEANQGSQPYLMYDAVDDGRTRDEHQAFDGVVFPVGHKFWRTNYPPNGYNCRCGTVPMDADDLEEYNLKPTTDEMLGTKEWLNPRTEQIETLPLGVDPGFAHNAGMGRLDTLKQLQQDKLNDLPTEQRLAADLGIKLTV